MIASFHLLSIVILFNEPATLLKLISLLLVLGGIVGLKLASSG